ncbi:uncharacterized protein [Acropora muricata]|uniref:uncharacterized protein n=1 Tax=Acropora muricata TaxID=159855 RepID=UPI0034E45017
MEIHGLLPFLRKFVKNMNLRELAGQTAAIDASCWLHKGLSVSFAETGRRDRCGEIFQKCLISVKKAGVIPVAVFDGLSLPSKAGENERRRREKESLIRRAAEDNISPQEANKLRSQAAAISLDYITECINVMFKASLSGDGDVVDLSEVLEGLKISKKQFQEMCIAAGCDYLKNRYAMRTCLLFDTCLLFGYDVFSCAL